MKNSKKKHGKLIKSVAKSKMKKASKVKKTELQKAKDIIQKATYKLGKIAAHPSARNMEFEDIVFIDAIRKFINEAQEAVLEKINANEKK